MVTKKKLTLASIYSTKNRRRQEGFDPSDMAYLKTKPKVKLGKKLGEGCFGAFYTLEGNNKLGVKVPKCELDGCVDTTSEQKKQTCRKCWRKGDIKKEAKNCHKAKFDDKSLLSATRPVPVSQHGMKCIGLVRPLVNEINARNLTNSQLEMIRQKVIALSKEGVSLHDGLQFGFTSSGRALQFDLGHVRKTTVSRALIVNNEAWQQLLEDAGKFGHMCPHLKSLEGDLHMAEMFEDEEALQKANMWYDHIERVLDKYGRITR